VKQYDLSVLITGYGVHVSESLQSPNAS